MDAVIPGIDAVIFDIGGTLVEEAPAATPVDALVARPLPGVLEVVAGCARHHRVAALTDTAVMDEATVRALLAPVGLDALLEVVVTSHDVGAAKPDPRGVLEVCRRLGVSPGRALLVGDRSVDRDAAAAAGTAFVATDAGLPDAVTRAVAARSGPFGAAASAVEPLDEDARAAALARQAQLTKPAGSLGRLEEIGVLLAAITGRCPPPIPARPAVGVFAGDHGVVASGVTPWPQDITASMVANMANGGAAINAIARQVGAAVSIVDVGVAADVREVDGVEHRKVRAGTDDLLGGRAMTTADAYAALDVGAELASALVGRGHDLLVTGDMGIGNTTPSAALIAAFTRHDAAAVTGRGTGIDDTMLATKTKVVAQAVGRVEGFLDPVSVLAEVGGLEIAAIGGFVIGAAAARVPVVVDGVIACAALLAADALVPGLRRHCIAGHRSSEPGATVALAHLGLDPVLDLQLRLGEGTGACLAVPVVQAAARVLGEMATFDQLEPPASTSDGSATDGS
ncbi:MAG TPA: nicotinate-nucleotide--dimethylbenzimidazole phosphoribosyltransferase [Acidimicrobiia bacterium]|jgi:nicotinate-nucleotide--dimethylbenzimidazole phosphoribosyltransferase